MKIRKCRLILRKSKKLYLGVLLGSAAALGNSLTVFASSDMVLFSGTKMLAAAITGGLTAISTAVSGGFGVYNFFMLQSADERDEKKYKKKIKKCVSCAVGVLVFGSALTWILGFYGG